MGALRPQMDLAITQLHSFEHLEAARMCEEIIEQDPDCATIALDISL
jgi:hypothetical protein